MTMTLLKWLFESRPTVKVGDQVEMSSKNPNHLGFGVCAYSGMKGEVIETYDNGGFCINTGTSLLIVPLSKKRGIWIFLNGKLLYHKRIKK